MGRKSKLQREFDARIKQIDEDWERRKQFDDACLNCCYRVDKVMKGVALATLYGIAAAFIIGFFMLHPVFQCAIMFVLIMSGALDEFIRF